MIDLEKHAKHEKACATIGKILIFGDFFIPKNDDFLANIIKRENSGQFKVSVFIVDELINSFNFETAKDLYNYLILRV